ncbi:MAG: hypothetical protein IT196_10690 [Acidimicrobiales bacterium]|nr:hypothetical protein [Acidimicrobiales bacterium]
MQTYRTTDLLALILLLAGAVAVPVAGWVAGVILLWASPSWSRRAKALGTAVVPGGLAAPLLVLAVPMGEARCMRLADARGTFRGEWCAPVEGFRLPGWLGLSLFVALVVAPLVSAAFLLHCLRPPRPGHGLGRCPGA